MIYTVTFNPAIDYLVYVPELKVGSIIRSEKEKTFCGGKGINVSLVLQELGIKSTAMGFIAGFTGSAIEQALGGGMVHTDFVHLKEGLTRINVKIRSEYETDINGQGPAISENDIKALLGKLKGLKQGDTLVFAGSIPNTVPSDIYEKIMELLSGNFTYLDEIRERGSVIEKTFTDIEYEDLDDFNLSVPVKRMVWQTILVVREITKILGSAPERIFVEMARDENAKNEKKRTISRKKKFLDLYKACKSESRDWIKEIGETEEKKFRSKKLYLYYTQKGKCMYSGDPIELEDLFNDNLYDIDHIYPRHFVKDDSIENNLVLVKKQLNNHKSDRFPIESAIRQKQYSMWKSLVDAKFITKEKFERLIRNTTFEPEERAAFINRQIVETRQGTKTVTRIFEHSGIT